MILECLIFIFRCITYFYFYIFILSVFFGIFDFINFISLEYYYFIKDNLIYIYSKYIINKKNIDRFIGYNVIIFTKNNIKIKGFFKYIYRLNNFINNRIYFVIERRYISDKIYIIKEILHINFYNIKSIEYIDDIKSRKLYDLIKKYSTKNYPYDILKIIEDYI